MPLRGGVAVGRRARGVRLPPVFVAPPSLTYAQTILAEPSLVSYWRAGETTGTAAADQKAANAGVYVGTPTLNQTSLVTGGDPAVLLNGSSQRISIAGSASLQPVAPTLEAWIKLTSTPTGGTRTIFNVADDCFGLGVTIAGKLQAFFWNGATNRVTTGLTTLATATVYHVAASFNSATGLLTAWLNGGSDGASTFSTETIGWDAITASSIGSSSNGTAGTFFPATLDEIAFYSAPLSTGTLTAHYNKGLSG